MDSKLSSKVNAILAASTTDEWINMEKCADVECRLCNPAAGEVSTTSTSGFERCMVCFNDQVPSRAIIRCRVRLYTVYLSCLTFSLHPLAVDINLSVGLLLSLLPATDDRCRARTSTIRTVPQLLQMLR